MLQVFRNAWADPSLRRKILFTLLIVVIFRFGSSIFVPFLDPDAVKNLISPTDGTIMNYLDALTGGALSKGTLLAMSISPYINASIIVQLLAVAIPALERLQKEGDVGRKKLDTITKFVALGIALFQAVAYYLALRNVEAVLYTKGFEGVLAAVTIVACFVAGASLIIWLGNLITQHGIGNGISMILFANIVVSFPAQAAYIFKLIFNFDRELPGVGATANKDFWWIGTIIGVLGFAMILAMIAFMVFMTNSERRLPIQYAKRVVGRKMYGGQSTNLPLKLNMTGVMPIIFASSIVSIPATFAMFFGKTNSTKGFWGWANSFNQYHWAYILVFGILMICFAYFYIAISFNPVEVANNLKKNGGSIPGIRTGRPTSDYISKILSRTTFIGAICLLIIALVPMILGAIGNAVGTDNWAYALTYFSFSGNSLLIVVGVVLETVREIEAQMTMRNFKGFLE